MIACTSISPTHINKDIQKSATDSWISNGMDVYSFNSPGEVKILAPLYPNVTFIPTRRTLEHHFGKPYVSINAVLDWCKEQREDHFCLINSDIELSDNKELVSRIEQGLDQRIYMLNRNNYNTDKSVSTIFRDGIDCFFLHKKHLNIYPQSIFCFGQCHWDYWIPYKAIASGIDVKFIDNKFAFHKNHSAQYSVDHWQKTGRYFLWDTGLYQFDDRTQIPQMSRYVYNMLNTGVERVQL